MIKYLNNLTKFYFIPFETKIQKLVFLPFCYQCNRLCVAEKSLLIKHLRGTCKVCVCMCVYAHVCACMHWLS